LNQTPSKGFGLKIASIPGILLEKDERELLKKGTEVSKE